MSNSGTWIKARCGRLDHGGCGLYCLVKDNRIVRIKGNPEDPISIGYVCVKGLSHPERLSHPDRLRMPMKRKGKRGENQWEPISWPEALDFIARNLNAIKDKFGARAVAFCQGMPKGLEHFSLIRLANTFGSPNVVGPQDVCHIPREVSSVHTCGFFPVVDYDDPTECVFLWGSNPNATNEEGVIHRKLLRQLKNGTSLIVVDPRRTEMASRARIWLQLRPGSETALALSVLSAMVEEGLHDTRFTESWTHGFDALVDHLSGFTPEKMQPVTWVSAEKVREAARLYSAAKPAALHWGNGIEQNTSNFDTCRLLVVMMAITGNLDVPGGNLDAGEPPVAPLQDLVRSDLLPGKYSEMISFHHSVVPRFMVVPPSHFSHAVLTGEPYPVRAAYVHCSNPVLAYPDSRKIVDALKALDFLVVSEVFMTPTAALADVVLPAATHFEFNDIGHYGIGHGYILARPKVVDPPPECWPDIKIINELGKALGLEKYWHDNYESILEEVLEPSGLNYAQFTEQGILRAEKRRKKYETSGFRTPSGKVEIALSKAEEMKFPPLPQFEGYPEETSEEYPLILTSSKPAMFLCSSHRRIRKLRNLRPDPIVDLHPDTARALGISDGDEVRIKTPRGDIIQKARLWDGIDPRVVSADHGWWFPESGHESLFLWDRSNLNILTDSSKLGRAFGTPNLRAIACRVEKI